MFVHEIYCDPIQPQRPAVFVIFCISYTYFKRPVCQSQCILYPLLSIFLRKVICRLENRTISESRELTIFS